MANDDLSRLFQQCRPDEPLTSPKNPCYENCDDARGSCVALEMARAIKLSDPVKPDFRLFTGHRGVGKSTELHRLKSELENPADGLPFFVLYTDVTERLDQNDIEVNDLLVLLAAEVQAKMKEAGVPGFATVPTKLKAWWEDLTGVLSSQVMLKALKADVGLANLTLEIRNQVGARANLREQIELRATRLIDAINDLLETAIAGLRGGDQAGLVLIVDGLDKIAFRELQGGSNTHRRFFVNGADKLASLKTHVVYTVPINLAYSPDFTEVRQTFGWTCVPVPMIRLHESPAPATHKMPVIPGWEESAVVAPTASGLLAMKQLLEKRVQVAGLEMDAVFDDQKTVELLCKLTGGHPRHLLMFVRAAIGKVNALPLTRAALQSAVKDYAQSLGREIPGKFWPWLRHFQKPATGFPPGLPDEVRQGILLWLYVFEYTNHQQFYCLNPVIELLPHLHEGHNR
jgi:hypothetical protein